MLFSFKKEVVRATRKTRVSEVNGKKEEKRYLQKWQEEKLIGKPFTASIAPISFLSGKSLGGVDVAKVQFARRQGQWDGSAI